MTDPPPAVHVHVLSQGEVSRLCGQLVIGEQNEIIACALVGKRHCMILLPKGYTEMMLDHETAHCHGWKH